MNENETLKPLFLCGLENRFEDFEKLFHEKKSDFSNEELREAHMMRAQIKLWSTDNTLSEDIEKAGVSKPVAPYSCFADVWHLDSPNQFVVFPYSPDALTDFLEASMKAEETFKTWYGASGTNMIRLMQSQIFYFQGEYEKALALAEAHIAADKDRVVNIISSQYVALRSYLALGRIHETEQSMLEIVRLSQNYQECQSSYSIIRTWVNVTTGWCGDMPRFSMSGGDVEPVLNDRLEAIKEGISDLTNVENKFAAYAEINEFNTCTMREYYMYIFNALFWFQAKDYESAETFFRKVYKIASTTGLIQPIVEYGEQILPFLDFVNREGAPYSKEWLSTIAAKAKQYEEHLSAYRN